MDPSHRVPPHSLEAEMAVLGSMLLDRDAAERALESLTAHHFYQDSHRKIFQAIHDLHQKGTAVDLVTLSDELKRRKAIAEVGGAAYLTEVINAVSTAAHVEHYAGIVRTKSILRDLIGAGTKIVHSAYAEEKETDALLDEAEAQVFKISQAQTATGFADTPQTVHEVIENIEALHQKKSLVTGIPMAFDKLDQMTGGLQDSDLIILAARPSQGKTAFALNICLNVALKDHPVAFFSLEMSKHSIFQRLICSLAWAKLHEVRRGFFPRDKWTDLTGAAARISESPIYIDDTPGLSVMEVRARARRLASDLKAQGKPLKMIVIDYLQLMRGDATSRRESRQQEVSEISRQLKNLARDINVPVIALSQLSRRTEDKGRDFRPQLSDLRDSGAIEQDADIVMFIFREGYYRPNDPEVQKKAEIILAKQRNGPTGTVELQFEREFATFVNPTPHGEEAPEEEEPALPT